MKDKLRTNKTCLNCGAQVQERYCTHCGQENREPKESFWELVHHFFADITHYDSKFFMSMKDLLFKPGFLTREYIAGRRARYLNPVRMYVFISFLFFLLIFTFNGRTQTDNAGLSKKEYSVEDAHRFTDSLMAGKDMDTAHRAQTAMMVDSTFALSQKLTYFMPGMKTMQQFDSAQLALPPSRRLKGATKYIARKRIELKQKYGDRAGEVVLEKITHNIPKMMFVLLPFFALLLKLFYSWKRYFYVDRVIFSIHIHSFIFLLLLISMGLDHFLHTNTFFGLSFLLLFIYFIFALRNAYKESFIISFLKGSAIVSIYFVVGLSCFITLALLTAAMA